MAKIVLAWENGAGMGHAGRLSEMARALLARGHDVTLVWREPRLVSVLLPDLGQHPALHVAHIPVCQVPPDHPALPRPVRNHADLLLCAGYFDPARVTPTLSSWLDLLRTLQPDVLVADHAPAALLAAATLPRLRTAQVGTGYFQPPRAEPWPSLRFWEPHPPDPAHADTALQTIRQAQAACGLPPLGDLVTLLDTDLDLLLNWRELLPYGPPDTPRQTLIPPLPTPTGGLPPEWPAGPASQRCFAYLRATHPDIDHLLAALAEARLPTLLVMPGASPAQTELLALQRHIHLRTAPVDLSLALPEAALVVCHANAGTVQAALGHGLPLLLCPGHIEQWLTAYRVCELGAAISLQGAEVGVHGAASLRALVTDAHFRTQAQAFAQRHPAHDNGQHLTRLTEAIESLLPR